MLVSGGLLSATALKRDFSAKQRDKLSQSGAAMPDGSFPIVNGKDLANAIHLVGRASDPAKAKAHIITRARALGLVDSLPESWGVQKADLVDVFKGNPYHDKEGKFTSSNGTNHQMSAADITAVQATHPDHGVLQYEHASQDGKKYFRLLSNGRGTGSLTDHTHAEATVNYWKAKGWVPHQTNASIADNLG